MTQPTPEQLAAWKKESEESERIAALPTIPLAECEHGRVYRIFSRNLSYGVFNAEAKGFIGIRYKFGSHYLFTEYHWDTGAPFGTVNPKIALEKLPEGIAVAESTGDICDGCKRPVKYVKCEGEMDPTVEPPPETWFHTDDNTPKCKDNWARMVGNKPLFDLLWALQFPGVPQPTAKEEDTCLQSAEQ